MFWNKTSYAFKYPRFSEWLISEILKLWGSSFFSKCSKFYMDSKNAMKYDWNAFYFSGKFIQIGVSKFRVLWQEYLASADNWLTYSPNISDLIKREVYQLYLYQSDKIVGKMLSSVSFWSVWDPLARWLSKHVLEQEQLWIQVSTFFGVNSNIDRARKRRS